MEKNLIKIKSPVYINLMLTKNCNQHCGFCYLDCRPGNVYTPYRTLKKIIDKCADAEIFEINLFGGEPTLYPRFLDLVKYCKDYGFNVGFSSNGTLIDKKFVDELRDYADGVTISIHGFKKTHEQLTQKRNSYEKAINAVNLLLDANIPTSVNFTLNKKNKDELYNFGRYVLDNFDVGSFEAGRLIQTGRGKIYRNILDLSIAEYNKCFAELYELSKDYTKKVELSDAFPFCLLEKEEYIDLMHGCSAGIDFCGINGEGGVKICHAFDFEIGNIFETPLEEIWQNSKELEEFRSLNWVSEPCNNCSYFEKCLCGCKVTSDYMKDILLLENQNKINKPKTKSVNTKYKKERKVAFPQGKPVLLPDVRIRKDLEGYLIYYPNIRLYFTNNIGNEILQMCDGETNTESIVKSISKRYNLDYNSVEKDTKNFLIKVENFISYES
jgi:radical SAM protein with 4Fe4S-binding SPASM domain